MNIRILILIWFPLIIFGCGNKSEKTGSVSADSVSQVKSLPLPVVPAQIQDSREKLRYVLTHYWDAMNWRDTALVNNEEFMEQSMVNYFAILAKADSLVGADGVNRMIASASVNPSALTKVVEIGSRYLYEPESPMYDAAWHIPLRHTSAIPAHKGSRYLYEPESPMYDAEGYAMLLDQLILDPTNAGVPLETFEARHAQIMKNRVGRKAADFTFMDREGHRMKLSEAVAGTEETILLFYDPDCNVCEATERFLASSAKLNRLIGEGRLRIVAIDPFDSDTERWKDHADSLPRNWTVGRSPGGRIDSEEIYVIRATPAVYLLDGSMTVRVKDARDDEISSWAS